MENVVKNNENQEFLILSPVGVKAIPNSTENSSMKHFSNSIELSNF